MDRTLLYDILYALIAKDGREAELFGNCAPIAREAFTRSLPGNAFPVLWFEVPLAGDPWFDLHALALCEDLDPSMTFAPEETGGYPQVFEWFAHQERGARQLALSWDVGSGDISSPAVQLLVGADSFAITYGFLEAAGRPDAVSAYKAFSERIPDGWFACYSGVFPERPGHNLRVECIPADDLQRAYADDAKLLENDLRQTGLREMGLTLVQRCQLLARTPFGLEFQFDVDADGCAEPVFGASLRFACPPGEGERKHFDPDGDAGSLMQQVEAWGLADERWRLLSDAAFAMRVARGERVCTLFCYPAFVKLRWRDGEPIDAKAYLTAGAQ